MPLGSGRRDTGRLGVAELVAGLDGTGAATGRLATATGRLATATGLVAARLVGAGVVGGSGLGGGALGCEAPP